MLRLVRIVSVSVALCTVVGMLGTSAYAGTIIKLSLGSDIEDDIEFDGTTLSTVDDLVGATNGDQNTAVTYTDFLDALADIPLNVASFSLNGLTKTGFATLIMDVLVVQNFTGGTIQLYDDSDVLLLEGTLANSTLSGPLGPPATGALFTTTFGVVTDGTLQPFIDDGTLALSMTLTDINGGVGFSVTPSLPLAGPYTLNSFRSDATVAIVAEPVPEPAAAVLFLLGAALAIGRRASFAAGRSS
jgi:hypothetical protein